MQAQAGLGTIGKANGSSGVFYTRFEVELESRALGVIPPGSTPSASASVLTLLFSSHTPGHRSR